MKNDNWLVRYLNNEWIEWLGEGKVKGILNDISKRLDKKSIIPNRCVEFINSPPVNMIFNAFTLSPSDVKVVIVGKTPLLNGSDGMAFSTSSSLPLRSDHIQYNIMRELCRCYPFIERVDKVCSLSSWRDQGVLLLNESLTCNPSEDLKELWLRFNSLVINSLNKDVIHVHWGNIDGRLRRNDSLTLTCGSPSSNNLINNFIGNNHFIIVNEELIKRGKLPIKWTSLFDKWDNLL